MKNKMDVELINNLLETLESTGKSYSKLIRAIKNLEKQESTSKKVKIPKVVADYIDYSKDCCRSMFFVAKDKDVPFEVKDWLIADCNDELYARAWLSGPSGYEIE